jgi:DNA helicase-2/ATP-dependent DNA helicase PcrA
LSGTFAPVAEDASLTLAGQLSLLLDRTGYRAMLRDSRAENMDQKLENLAELADIAGGFHDARESSSTMPRWRPTGNGKGRGKRSAS